jgi:hypothetical protein
MKEAANWGYCEPERRPLVACSLRRIDGGIVQAARGEPLRRSGLPSTSTARRNRTHQRAFSGPHRAGSSAGGSGVEIVRLGANTTSAIKPPITRRSAKVGSSAKTYSNILAGQRRGLKDWQSLIPFPPRARERQQSLSSWLRIATATVDDLCDKRDRVV